MVVSLLENTSIAFVPMNPDPPVINNFMSGNQGAAVSPGTPELLDEGGSPPSAGLFEAGKPRILTALLEYLSFV
jgi:hypothetical protein